MSGVVATSHLYRSLAASSTLPGGASVSRCTVGAGVGAGLGGRDLATARLPANR